MATTSYEALEKSEISCQFIGGIEGFQMSVYTNYWPLCVLVVLAARGRSVKAGRPQLRIPPFIAPYARFSQLSSALSTDSSLWCQFALKKHEETRKFKIL